MKKNKFIKVSACIILVLIIAYANSGHIHLPGHGNWENKNLETAVVNHVSPTLSNGEKVILASKYQCEDYKENDEVRFSANIVYYIVSSNRMKKEHVAHVICNEDKDTIIEWKDIY